MPIERIYRNNWLFPSLNPLTNSAAWGNGKVYQLSTLGSSVTISLSVSGAQNGVGGYRDYGAQFGIQFRELLGTACFGYADSTKFAYHGDVTVLHRRWTILDNSLVGIKLNAPANGTTMIPSSLPSPVIDNSYNFLILDLVAGVTAVVQENAHAWAWQD